MLKIVVYIPVVIDIDNHAEKIYNKRREKILQGVMKQLADLKFSKSSGFVGYEKKKCRIKDIVI